jgi:hypothetical protein
VRTLLPNSIVVGIFAAVVALLIAVDAGLIRRPTAFASRQVPIEWSTRFGFPIAFGLYGVILGAAVFTYVPFAVAYGVVLAAALFAPLPLAVASGLLLGLGRAVIAGPAALSRGLVTRSDRYLVWGYRRYPIASVVLSAFLVAVVLTHVVRNPM